MPTPPQHESPEDRSDGRSSGPAFHLLDGGLASELERRGHALDDPMWSASLLLEDPEAISSVHRDYARAGADYLCTATYQAHFDALRARGWDGRRARAFFAHAADLARVAAETCGRPGVRVLGSLGSYAAARGQGGEYTGDLGAEPSPLLERRLLDFHFPRIEALGPHVDGILLETMPSAFELELLLEHWPEGSIDSLWIGLSLGSDTTGSPLLADGTPLASVATALARHPAVAAIGVNCCDPGQVERALQVLDSVTKRPLIAYPNSGASWSETEGWSQDTALDPEAFAAQALDWLRAGASVLGGCCQTRPAHIAALAELRRQLGPR